jgi:hypothetical protein
MYFKSLFTVCALMLGLTATASQVQANYYGAFKIDNPTSNTIHYQVKWGNGEWKEYTLLPNQAMNHWCQVDERGQTPTPEIRFDYILNDGLTTLKTYRLETIGTSDFTQGKRFVFRVLSGLTYPELELYAG